METLRTSAVVVALFSVGLWCGLAAHRSLTSDRESSPGRSMLAPVTMASSEAGELAVSSESDAAIPDFAVRLAGLAKIGSRHKRVRAIAEIADGLDILAIRSALTALASRSTRDASAIRLQLLARWAELEPVAALHYAMALPIGSEAPSAIAAVIRTWAAIDVAAAEEEIARLPEHFAKRLAQSTLLPALSNTAPERAFASLQGIPFYSDDLTEFFGNWARQDPEQAATHAATLTRPWQRKAALRDVMRSWAERDRESALGWAQASRSVTLPGGTIEVSDPGPLATTLQTWMTEEPSAALRWLDDLPDDTSKQSVLTTLSKSLIDQEPQQAIEVAAMMTAGKAQDAALRKISNQWSESDFASARAWAEQQTDEGIRSILLPPLAANLAQRDPPAALRLAQGIGGEAGTRALMDVMRTWTRQEPLAAAEWAGAQPEAAPYLASVAETWAQKDPARAFAWVNTIEASAGRDEALARGIGMIAQSDQPQSAERWISAISSPEKRAVAYRVLTSWWLQNDPKRAREWIETAPLPAETKAELLKKSSR